MIVCPQMRVRRLNVFIQGLCPSVTKLCPCLTHKQLEISLQNLKQISIKIRIGQVARTLAFILLIYFSFAFVHHRIVFTLL